ncbi:hypothetical protein ACFX1Z_000211 [Malus domestica]
MDESGYPGITRCKMACVRIPKSCHNGLFQGLANPWGTGLRDERGTLCSTPYGWLPWSPKGATGCTKVTYGFQKIDYGLPFEQ